MKRLTVFFRDLGLDLALGEACGDFVSDIDPGSVLEELTFGVENQGVAAIEDCQRRE